MFKLMNGAILAGLVAGSVALVAPSNANATLISIGEALGAAPVATMATDMGTGFVSASGTVGNFTLTSATATGSPILPVPTLNTASIDVSSAGGGTLHMFITEQGLTTPLGINNFLSSFTFNLFNGPGITSVTESTFISTSNVLYAGALLASATDSTGGLSTAAVVASTPSLTGLYSETVEYTIVANGMGSTNDTVNISAQPTAVPEPASLGILGAGLCLLSLVARRRRSV